MTARRVYLSTTIPYVNSRAHVGHALELVQADVLARHHRRIGDEVDVVMTDGGYQPYLFCTSRGTLFCQAQLDQEPIQPLGHFGQ